MDFFPSSLFASAHDNAARHPHPQRREPTTLPPRRHLIILNQPITSFSRLATIWRNTTYRVCADGGANRLHDLIEAEQHASHDDYLPSLIHGDLDSLRPDVRAFYTARGVQLTRDPDQYSTDFGKCVKLLTGGHASHKDLTRLSSLPSPLPAPQPGIPHRDEDGPSPAAVPGQAQAPGPETERESAEPDGRGLEEIVILSSLCGRVDHSLGLLGELYRETVRAASPLRLWLLTPTALSFLLPCGRNCIRGISVADGLFTRNAGVLPIYGAGRITIKGFEWDVEGWETKMGERVTTSNHVLGDEVEILVEGESMLFTIELAGSGEES